MVKMVSITRSSCKITINVHFQRLNRRLGKDQIERRNVRARRENHDQIVQI